MSPPVAPAAPQDPRLLAGGPLPPGSTDENPAGVSFPALLVEDFRTHGSRLTSAGFLALAVHRFGNWRMSVKTYALRAPLTLAYRVAYHTTIAAFGIDLPYNVKIGRRVRFVHHGCVVLGAWSVGDDVLVRGPVTVGLLTRTGSRAPIIGNRVEIGPRACIVGGIRVGDDAYVGPCTVLTQDLPAGAAALGNPCRRVELAELLETAR